MINPYKLLLVIFGYFVAYFGLTLIFNYTVYPFVGIGLMIVLVVISIFKIKSIFNFIQNNK